MVEMGLDSRSSGCKTHALTQTVMCVCMLVDQLCLSLSTSWTGTQQVSLSIEFPRQEYWSELPFPSPGDLPRPGIKVVSPALAGRFFTTEPIGKAQICP